MISRQHYSLEEISKRIPHGEPYIVLRASDPQFQDTLEFYISRVKADDSMKGVNPDKWVARIISLMHLYNRTLVWLLTHKPKPPEMPREAIEAELSYYSEQYEPPKKDFGDTKRTVSPEIFAEHDLSLDMLTPEQRSYLSTSLDSKSNTRTKKEIE